MSNATARLGSSDEDFQQLGIDHSVVRPWEDGARTDGSPGTYEWWYFDAHLDDGAKLVVVFLTKEFTDITQPLKPMIRLELELPDGTAHNKIVTFPAGQFTASSEGCDVRIGDHSFSGDLHTYRITAELDGVSVDVTLTGEVPSWRPGTGHWWFGPGRHKLFAWLPAVPQGVVRATYQVGQAAPVTTGGSGYHDHNWGNAPVNELINHWYWARGEAGPYTVIASHIAAEKRYGDTALPVFLLAKDGRVLADDGSRVTFEALGTYRDETTGKPVAGVTRYLYRDGDDTYIVSFVRERDLAAAKLIDNLAGPKKLAARLARFDGAYLRFTGELRVERRTGSTLVDTHAAPAIWELMYLGPTHGGPRQESGD
ncbi:hydroxyneurosporene dehydrogenase [Streptomyces rubiginosohelvolus]|uniref:hydroxyneurosporene dehydrogenase n=1 Tax=Streptomyces rubiginosohelvolus TaxID=67362 RepID=UPI0033BA143A